MKKIFVIFFALLMLAFPFFGLTVGAEQGITDVGGETVKPDASGTLVGEISWSYFSQSGRLEIKGEGEIPDFYETEAPWKSAASAATSLVVGEGISGIGAFAFSDMLNLAAITLPYSVTRVGEDAFYNTYYYNYDANRRGGVLYIGSCLIDADATVARSFTVKQGTRCIADGAFSGIKTLYSVTMPEGVTHIGASAFENCKTLKLLYLPSTIKEIGENATAGCEKLGKITFSANAETAAKVSVLSGNDEFRVAQKVFAPATKEPEATKPGSSDTQKKPMLGNCSMAGFASFAAALASAAAAAFVIKKR